MKCRRENGSFASLPSHTQHFVFIFFRHIEKDKKEAVLRTQCSDRGDGDECALCPTWTRDPALRLLLPWKEPPPAPRVPAASLTVAHRRTKEMRKLPSAKPSYFSTVGPTGYTWGPASIPFLQNKAHW